MHNLNPPLRLGLTIWSHNAWQNRFYGQQTRINQRLEKYAQVFNTTEGNSTFYALPNMATILNWRDITPENFRFTFKLPREITHQAPLHHSKQQLTDMMHLFEPLHDKIGLWTIQLPASFSPNEFAQLEALVAQFPQDAPLAVEVRHPRFFDKSESETRFNRWLIEKQIDRIIMDSRPIFSPRAQEVIQGSSGNKLNELIDGQNKKPRVPVHAISTATHPMVRFVGLPDLEDNPEFLAPWYSKMVSWIAEGKQPYFMIHTSDNDFAPELAAHFYQQLSEKVSLPQLPPFPATLDPQQISMF